MRKEGEDKAIKSLNKHKLSEEKLQKELQQYKKEKLSR